MSSRAQALGFLVATIVGAIAVAVVETRGLWKLAGETELAEPNTASYLRLLKTATAAYDSSNRVPLVTLIGGSAIRELSADDEFFSRQLSAACGTKVRFVNLGSSIQTFNESWALAVLAPADQRHLVVFGLSPVRMDADPATVLGSLGREPMGLPATLSLKMHLAAWTGRIPNWFDSISVLRRLDALGLKWSLADLFRARGPVSPLEPAADPYQAARSIYVPPVLSLKGKQEQSEEYIAWRGDSIRWHAPEATRMWAVLANLLQSGGSRVAFLVPPQDKVFEVVDKWLDGTFDRSVAQLARSFPVLDLRSAQGLEADDFYDLQHLVASGRRKLHPQLLDAILGQIDCESLRRHSR